VTGSATAGGSNYTAGTWTNKPVIVTFSCADPLSGPDNTTITGGETVSTQQITTANGSCKDNAGNLGTGSFGPINIDTTGPVIVVTSPMPNQQFILNSQISPGFSCGEGNGGIDTVTCVATPSGSPYTASSPGPGTFSVSATDQAGNSASSGNIPYLVTYNFTGFLPPLLPATPASAALQSDSGSFVVGTTISVQWQLQDGTPAFITPTIDPNTLKTVQAFSNATCTGGPTGTAIALYDSSNSSLMSGLTFDSTTNTFSFAWNTTGLSAGCYNLVVTLDDTTQNATIVHLATDQVAFLSAAEYNGNLGGTAGGDAACQTEATKAGLPGTYKAWLSTSANSPAASSFTQSTLQYVQPDRALTPIAANWTGLTTAALTNGFTFDAQGVAPPSDTDGVWTGTNPDGTATGNDCQGWTVSDANFTGIEGIYSASKPTDWSNASLTGGSAQACSSNFHLYCFQQ